MEPSVLEVFVDRDPILVEREKTHGNFVKVAEMAQIIKDLMRNSNRSVNSRQEEAYEMIATKLARIVHGNSQDKDHWLDIAGYAKLGAEACDGQ